MSNDSENFDSTNEAETTENNEELNLDLSDEDSVDVDALKKEIATLKAQKEHFKKKAESKTEVKTEVKDEAPAPLQELSSKDALLLAKADVDLEDVDEVVDFAKYRKIPIADAIKNPTLKAILSDRKEERQTALATQTNSSRKSSSVSVDTLIDRAKKGEGKEEDIDKIVAARLEAKLKH